jgi:hypothetical protein
MKRAVFALCLCGVLAGCGGTTSSESRAVSIRQLSEHEKQVLASAFSQKLSGGAEFKWMPILGTPIAEKSWIPSISGPEKGRAVVYCGLVSEGGGPYRVFAATVAPGSGGEYDHGAIDSVDGVAGKAPASGAATERCHSAGYSEFRLAQ